MSGLTAAGDFLPGWLMQWLNWGAAYPKGDQDQLFALGDAWKQAASDLKNLEPELRAANNKLSQYYVGDGGAAAVKELATLLGESEYSIPTLVASLESLGADARSAATEIEYTKIQEEIFALLTLWGVLSLMYSAAGSALAPAYLVAARTTLAKFASAAAERIGLIMARNAAKKMAAPLVRNIGVPVAKGLGAINKAPAIIKYPALGAIGAGGGAAIGAGMDAAIQGVQMLEGNRDNGYDLKRTFQTALEWGAGGAVGAPVHGLLSAGLGKLIPSMLEKQVAGKGPAAAKLFGETLAGGLGGLAGGGGMYAAGLGNQYYDKGNWNDVDKKFHYQLALGGLGMGGLGGARHGMTPHDGSSRTAAPESSGAPKSNALGENSRAAAATPEINASHGDRSGQHGSLVEAGAGKSEVGQHIGVDQNGAQHSGASVIGVGQEPKVANAGAAEGGRGGPAATAENTRAADNTGRSADNTGRAASSTDNAQSRDAAQNRPQPAESGARNAAATANAERSPVAAGASEKPVPVRGPESKVTGRESVVQEVAPERTPSETARPGEVTQNHGEPGKTEAARPGAEIHSDAPQITRAPVEPAAPRHTPAAPAHEPVTPARDPATPVQRATEEPAAPPDRNAAEPAAPNRPPADVGTRTPAETPVAPHRPSADAPIPRPERMPEGQPGRTGETPPTRPGSSTPVAERNPNGRADLPENRRQAEPADPTGGVFPVPEPIEAARPNDTQPARPDSSRGGNASDLGSFRGDARPPNEPNLTHPELTREIEENLAAVKPEDAVWDAEGSRFVLEDGTEIHVRVGESDPGTVAKFTRREETEAHGPEGSKQKPAYEVTVSERARTEDVARAVAHEVAEIRLEQDPAILRDPISETPAQMTTHLGGRFAELKVLDAQLDRALQDKTRTDEHTRLRNEIAEVLDELGMRDPATKESQQRLLREHDPELARRIEEETPNPLHQRESLEHQAGPIEEYRPASLEDLGFRDLEEVPLDIRHGVEQALPVTKMVPTEEVRFTQRSVSRETSDGIPIEELANRMAETGWRGGPAHAVLYEDGRVVSLDNRRLTAARMAGIEEVPIALHSPSERLADWAHEWDQSRRERNPLRVEIRELADGTLRVGGEHGDVAYRPGRVAETWDEIALFRAAEQRSLLPGDLLGSEHAPVYAAKPADKVTVDLATHDREQIAEAVRQARPDADQILTDLHDTLNQVNNDLNLQHEPLKTLGEDHRVKSAESLERKYYTDRTVDKQTHTVETVESFLERTNDIVRYSIQLPEGTRYTPALEHTLNTLRERGYEIVDVKNFWQENNRYININATLKSATGREFEVQFPTDAAWRANKLTHTAYEVFRVEQEPIERRVHALLDTLRINKELELGQHIPEGLSERWPPKDTSFAKWVEKNPELWTKYHEWLTENNRDFSWVTEQFGLEQHEILPGYKPETVETAPADTQPGSRAETPTAHTNEAPREQTPQRAPDEKLAPGAHEEQRAVVVQDESLHEQTAPESNPEIAHRGAEPVNPVHALIDEALPNHPEIAKVVRDLVEDSAHPLDLTRALLDPSRRDSTLKILAELADGEALGNRSLAEYLAENPGHGSLFEELAPEVNHLPDGQTRLDALVAEAKAIDPARQVGAHPTTAERAQVAEYARRLFTDVQPAVKAELARLTEVVDGARTSLRTKSGDGIIDKVQRMVEGGENRPPRPNYQVGDVIDAVGARITVKNTHDLAILLERIQEHFGVGEHSRILEIENMYATPKGRNPEYRVIPLVVRIDIDGIPHTYELQLTTQRASIAADINHNTIYKPYVETTPEQLAKINKMFAEAAALDQREARASEPRQSPVDKSFTLGRESAGREESSAGTRRGETGTEELEPRPRQKQAEDDGPRRDEQQGRRDNDEQTTDPSTSHPPLPKYLQRVYDGGVDIAGGRAYYDGDPKSLALAKVAKPVQGYYMLDMHGSSLKAYFGREDLYAAELAKLIRADPNWKGQPVWMNVCEAGKGDNPLAQLVANNLGVKVKGATTLVWGQGDGTTVVSSASSRKGYFTTPHDGKMLLFRPKK
ncbi:hypothetical protein [Nocardia yamanashiensis]|uniref:WXG100-like domain-containing protein n=1 Tax=Nocardia yamanashiensis TaxID=209247 RepID=UPI00082EADB1|nr:hypothetical protein [Nocardia yamanashiensis]